MKFKFVPEEMRRLFDQNMRQAIQDVIGMSMESDLKLYKNRALYKEATNGVSNMFYKDTFILSMNDQIPISEYFKFDFKQPTTQHFIHVDQAVTRDANQKIQNRLGMACAHIERFEKVAGELLPYVHVDFLLSINPPEKPDEIPLWKIRQFIIWLRDSGLNIGKVTFDQFQSRDQMQILMQNNITSERYSVDMDDKDWLSLVKLFYERRIRLPYHKIFVEEFFKLEHDLKKHRVNHSAGEFKDLSDALTGACANAILNTNVGAWNLSQFVDQGKKKNETGNIYEMIKNNKLPGMF
jgi:hypothetical protein